MITYIIDYETVMEDYPEKANEILNILRNSNSKYKNVPIEKIYWTYSFNYFLKKGESSPEYYDNLTNMIFEDRVNCEIKKVRANLGANAGHFYISDRVETVSDSIKRVVEIITMRKMIAEQSIIGNNEVIKSIPIIKEKIPDMSLQDQLKHAIDVEDYMEAARIRDLMNVDDSIR